MKRALLLCLGAAAGLVALLGVPLREPPLPEAPRGATEEPPPVTEPIAEVPRSLVPTAPADAAGEPEAEVSRVTGRVIDAFGQPIRDCAVALDRAAGGPWLDAGTAAGSAALVARTDALGRFTLTPGDAGPFALSLRHEQFPPRVVAARLAVTRSIALGDLVLSSTVGALVDVVAAADGAPVADALLTLEPEVFDADWSAGALRRMSRAGRSGPDGRAVFYGVEPGAWRIRVEALGYATTSVRHEQPRAATAPARLTVRLPPGERLRGTLHTAGGRPVADAEVQARPIDVDAPDAWTRTAPDGGFRLTGLLPGRYRLRATTPGNGAVTAEIAVPSAAPLALVLPAAATLRGTVRASGSGAPVAGARVTLRPEWGVADDGRRVVHTRRTGPRGDFAFEELPPGRFHLHVTSERLVARRTPTVEIGRSPPEPIEVLMDPAGGCAGRVVDPSGQAVSGAQIEVMTSDFDGTEFAEFLHRTLRGGRSSVATAEDGRFAVAGLPPGSRWRLRVSARGHPIAITAAFPVSGGRVHELGDLALPPGGRVVGRLVDGRGEPLAGVPLRADPIAASATDLRVGAATTTGASGVFELGPLAPGAYELFYTRLREAGPGGRDRDPAARGSTEVRVTAGVDTRCELVLSDVR